MCFYSFLTGFCLVETSVVADIFALLAPERLYHNHTLDLFLL